MKKGEETSISKLIAEYGKKRKNLRTWSILVGALAIFVALGVGIGLRYIGQALTNSEPVLCCTIEEHTHTEECYEINEAGEKILVCGYEVEHTHDDSCYEEVVKQTGDSEASSTDDASLENVTDMSTEQAEEALAETESETATEEETETEVNEEPKLFAMLFAANGAEANLTVTDVKVNNSKESIRYDEYTETFEAKNMRTEYKISAADLINAGYKAYYEYPSDIIIPDELLNREFVLMRGTQSIGTYTFTKNGEGENATYSVHIQVDEDSIKLEDIELVGYVEFDSRIKKTASNGQNEVIVQFGDVKLIIEGEDIDWGGEEKTENYDLSSGKTGKYDPVNNTLSYEAKLKTNKGTPDVIHFEDTFKPNGVEVDKLDKIQIKDQNGNAVSVTNQKIYQDANGNWKLEMDLPGLSANSEYTISYQYQLKAVDEKVVYKPGNKIHAESENKKTGEIVKTEREISVEISNEYKLQKSYSYTDKTNYKNHWWIGVNNNKKNIAGGILYDDSFEQMNDFSISPNEGYEFFTDENGKKCIRFKGLNGTDINTNSYSISYTTPIDTFLEEKTYTNKVWFDGDGDKTWDVEQEVKQEHVSGAELSKWVNRDKVSVAKDQKTIAIPWSATITLPSGENAMIPKGTVISDTMKNHLYMTQADVKAWGGKLDFLTDRYNYPENISDKIDASAIDYNLTFYDESGIAYTYAEAIMLKNAKVKYYRWTLTFPKDVKIPEDKKALGVRYQTTGDISDLESDVKRIFENEIQVGDLKAKDTYPYLKRDKSVVKTDGNGNTEETTAMNTDGSLTWVVEVKTDDAQYKYLDIIDQLPNGVELKKMIIEIYDKDNNCQTQTLKKDNNWYQEFYNYIAECNYDQDSGKVNLQVRRRYPDESGRLSNAFLKITYECKLTRKAIENEEVDNLTNTVVVKSKDGEFGTASQTQNWRPPRDQHYDNTITKDGKYDADKKQIKYRVEINPEGKDLLEKGDILTLKDYLKYFNGPREFNREDWQIISRNVILDRSSVKLYYASLDENHKLQKGGQVKDWTWTYEETKEEVTNWNSGDCEVTSIITANIPDKTPLILEYTYIVDIVKNGDWAKPTIGVKNNVTLEGKYNDDEDTIADIVYKEVNTSGGVLFKKSYTFYKVKRGSFGTALPDAKFAIFKQINDQQVEYVTDYITDKNGVFTVEFEDENGQGKKVYEENTLYYTTEIEAPDGYMLPDAPEKFYFYFRSANRTDNLFTNYNAVNLSGSAYYQYVENDKIPTAFVEIQKNWKKYGGVEDMPLTQAPKSITVVLHQSFTKECKKTDPIIGTYLLQEKSFQVKEGTQTQFTDISSIGAWHGLIEELPKSIDGKTCYYWVEEIEINYEENKDYDVAYDQTEAMESGKVTITNTNNQNYSLPETGGRGTVLYRIRNWMKKYLMAR